MVVIDRGSSEMKPTVRHQLLLLTAAAKMRSLPQLSTAAADDDDLDSGGRCRQLYRRIDGDCQRQQ